MAVNIIPLSAGHDASITDSELHVPAGKMGIDFSDSSSSNRIDVSIARNLIHSDANGVGVRIYGAEVDQVTIDQNQITGFSTGIEVENGSPSIQNENFIHHNSTGIWIKGVNQVQLIDGNIVEHNSYSGIYCAPKYDGTIRWSGFEPTITGNSIRYNTQSSAKNIRISDQQDSHGAVVVIDATDNSWGTDDPTVIDDEILDAADDANGYNSKKALVDFTPYVDSLGQSVKTSVQAHVDADSFGTVDPAVVGPIVISSSSTPGGSGEGVIPAGVTLRMPPDATINVYGVLYIQGTSGSPVTILSDNPTAPMKGDWQGIKFHRNGSSVDWAVIQHAVRAIDLRPREAPLVTSIDVRNSKIQLFSEVGINLETATSASDIDGNTIDNFPDDTMFAVDGEEFGTGIWLIDSSPHISDNKIQDLEVGIHISKASNPVIDGGNIITENIWGLWIQGPGGEAVTANPQPTINGNDIFQNDGSAVPLPSAWYYPPEQGGGATTEALEYLKSPAPRCNHLPANICVSDFTAGGSGVAIDATGNWWGATDLPTIQAGINFHPQSVTEIEITNYLNGSSGSAFSPGTAAWAAAIFEVSHDPPRFSPRDGETVQITFSLAVAGDVTLKIYNEDPEQGTNAVYTENLGNFTAGGPHAVTWNGKADSTFFVPDEAYAYELELGAGGAIGSYKPILNEMHFGYGCDPAINPLNISCNSLPIGFNTFRNEFWQHDYQLIPNTYADSMDLSNSSVNEYPYQSFPSRVTLKVRSPAGGGTWWPAIERVPVLPSKIDDPNNLHHFVFDGRLEDGSILSGDADFHLWPPEPMKLNAVIVDGSTPRVRGSETAGAGASWVPPSIEVKANPYLVQHSYEHVTHIAYQLNTDARVTVTVNDSNGTPVDTLWGPTDGTNNDGVQESEENGLKKVWVIPWTGVGTGNDSNNFVSGDKGAFTFEIRAEDKDDPTLFSTYKGVIQVRQ